MRNGSFDAIVIGAGIMGLSLAIELRQQLGRVFILERGTPGRESSYAAAGMLNLDPQAPPALASFSGHSADLYPRFIEDIRSKTRCGIEFQRTGAIVLDHQPVGERLTKDQLRELEPEIDLRDRSARFVQEDFVAPRSLMAALQEHAEQVGITIAHHNPVHSVSQVNGRCNGVRSTSGEAYASAVVVNCAGAWAAEIVGTPLIPTRPVKGQMLALDPGRRIVRHVIRCAEPEVYMLPRASGTVAIGATVEDVGEDRSTTTVALEGLRHAAETVVPALAAGKLHESWAGMRPGSPDGLPIIGETSLPGYFAATGHFRHGILLAPATAEAMGELIRNGRSRVDLTAFSPLRFSLEKN